MIVIRSWPANLKPHEQDKYAHVHDRHRLLYISDYDYKDLRTIHDDVILLEWDIAVDVDRLQQFIDNAITDNQQIRIAPYKLYRDDKPGVYCAFRYNPPGSSSDVRWINEDDQTCHLFGFGMTYLPAWTIREYFSDSNNLREPVTDGTFSRWYYRHTKAEVPIDWDCAPVHLNYDLSRLRF